MVESEAAVDLQMFPIDRKAHAASPRSFLTRRVPARRRLGYAFISEVLSQICEWLP